MFGGFAGVVRGVVKMALGNECMVCTNVMIASFMTGSGFAMMASGVLVVLGGFAVMLNGMNGHRGSFAGEFRGRREDGTPGMMNEM